jgi:hypothetical protein
MWQLQLTRKTTTLENEANAERASLNNFAHFNENHKFAKLLRRIARR